MKKRILFPVVAVLLALSAAFATEAMKDEKAVFASVEYKSGGSCLVDPNCSTNFNTIMCTSKYELGSDCKKPVSSWRP